MKNYNEELKNRVAFLQKALKASGAKGFVYGNSGGKDSALAGILCKKACADTLGVIMPCGSARNYGEDARDALLVAGQYGIETTTVDLSSVKQELLRVFDDLPVTQAAGNNIAPRLRMTALYALAQSRNALVCGTGNRSEGYMGYFTKWGDGAYDVNPIADLTVTEIYEFLRFLGAPAQIIEKAPSAGLFDGQTDEAEMGVSYAEIDALLSGEEISEKSVRIIRAMHEKSAHKRTPPLVYGGDAE